MKKLFSIVVTLLALAVGALLIVPGQVDWNRFKTPVAEALSGLTGWPIALSGDLRLSMLPVPTLSVADVEIAGLPGAGEPQLLRLGRLDVRVALLPLLGGRIEVEHIILNRPELVLETLADGRRGWLPPAATGTAPPLPRATRLDRVELRDGTLVRRDGGTTTRLTGIQARITAASLAGPFELKGEATLEGVALAFEGATGGIGEGSTTPVRLALALADGSAQLRFAGLAADGGEPRLQGDLRLEAAQPARALAQLAAALGASATALPPALDQPLTVHGALDATARLVALNGLDLQSGETSASGNARLVPGSPPALDLKLAAGRLDLEPWLGGGGGGFRLPGTLTARLELAVDALGFRQGLLRQARLAARLDGGKLAVERLSLQGPGGSDLALAGTIAGTAAGQPAAELVFEAGADNLRMLLDWLRIDTGGIAADRLRRMTLKGTLRGSPDDVQIGGLDLRLDTTRLTGAVSYRDAGRPALGLRLELDHLDLDAYRGDGRGGPGDIAGRLAALLGRGDATVQVRLGHLVSGGQALRGLEFDGTADHGALVIRSARIGELAGIGGTLQGRLDGLAPLRGVDLSFSAETGSLTTAERVFGLTLPPPLRRLGALRLTGHATGDAAALAFELAADGAGGRVDAAGTLETAGGRPAGPVRLHAAFAETGRLVRLFAPDYQSAGGADPGPTDVSAELTGDGNRWRLGSLAGTLAGVTVQGQASADLSGPKPVIDVQLQAGEIGLDRLLPGAAPQGPPRRAGLWPPGNAAPPRPRWSAEPLDFGWLGAADGQLAVNAAGVTMSGRRLGAPVLRASLAGGALRLEQLDGELMGGRFGAGGRLAPGDGGAEAALTLTLVGARIERGLLYAGSLPGAVDIGAGALALDLDLKSRGDSEAALVGALAGSGRFAVTDGRLQGIDLPGLDERIGSLRRAQDVVGLLSLGSGDVPGETAFDRLDGSVAIERGIISSSDVKLAAPAGTGEAHGSVDLPERTLNIAMQFRVRHEPPLPAIGLTFSGSLDRPHRAVDTRELQGYLAQKLTGSVMRHLVPAVPGGVPPGDFVRGLFQSLPH